MLYFDTTSPAAALPAMPTPGAPAAPGTRKGASEAFGDLLSLLSAVPSDAAQKTGARAGSPALPAGVPFAFAPTAAVAKPDAATAKSAPSLPGSHDAAARPAAAAADGDQTLSDNLTWLLAMTTAPVDVPAPAPTTFPGDAAGETASDATACAATSAPAASAPAAGSAALTVPAGTPPQMFTLTSASTLPSATSTGAAGDADAQPAPVDRLVFPACTCAPGSPPSTRRPPPEQLLRPLLARRLCQPLVRPFRRRFSCRAPR